MVRIFAETGDLGLGAHLTAISSTRGCSSSMLRNDIGIWYISGGQSRPPYFCCISATLSNISLTCEGRAKGWLALVLRSK